MRAAISGVTRMRFTEVWKPGAVFFFNGKGVNLGEHV
jgi:hypothetical protein